MNADLREHVETTCEQQTIDARGYRELVQIGATIGATWGLQRAIDAAQQRATSARNLAATYERPGATYADAARAESARRRADALQLLVGELVELQATVRS